MPSNKARFQRGTPTEATGRPRIAVFSGPTATVQNTAPLITSNKAAAKYGLPPIINPDGSAARFDALRTQRLAAPVTVYIEQFSGHPLERDASHLYADPDGYVGTDGRFRTERQSVEDVPAYEVVLEPEDGLYMLPFMGRQADGKPWDEEGAFPGASPDKVRQPFYPDGSRLFEEIDRLGNGPHGTNGLLSSKADFDFFRPAPPAGYMKGLAATERTDAGRGDIAPEALGEDFFPYKPKQSKREPHAEVLGRLTNSVQSTLATGIYSGAIWLEGSPWVEETSYWLNLLIGTNIPFVTTSSPDWTHGVVGNVGDRNIIDAVEYIVSRVWTDEMRRNSVGVVYVNAGQIFTAREVQKEDARSGGYIATGGHGGIIGAMAQTGPPVSGPPVITFRPNRKHTWESRVRCDVLPEVVQGSERSQDGTIRPVDVRVKEASGDLLPGAIPKVTIAKHARYLPDDGEGDPDAEVEIIARIEKNLSDNPLAGFVGEGGSPYGQMSTSADRAFRRATFSGMPVVKVGRGNAGGILTHSNVDLEIAGGNLTATKARMLLMACLLRFGALPPTRGRDEPTPAEIDAIRQKLKKYQEVFDTH